MWVAGGLRPAVVVVVVVVVVMVVIVPPALLWLRGCESSYVKV